MYFSIIEINKKNHHDAYVDNYVSSTNFQHACSLFMSKLVVA